MNLLMSLRAAVDDSPQEKDAILCNKMEQGWAKTSSPVLPALLENAARRALLLNSKLQNWKLQGRSRVVDPSAFYSDKSASVHIE